MNKSQKTDKNPVTKTADKQPAGASPKGRSQPATPTKSGDKSKSSDKSKSTPQKGKRGSPAEETPKTPKVHRTRSERLRIKGRKLAMKRFEYKVPTPKTKPWIPPELRPKEPRKKIEIMIPVPTTHKWVPPDQRKKKPPPPKYEAPRPEVTRKWIPPFLRKKPPKPEPKVTPPPGAKTIPVPHSKIPKGWGPFKFFGNLHEPGVIVADYSQENKKFGKNAGLQDLANCVVFCGYTRRTPYPFEWTRQLVTSFLEAGNKLYEFSIKKLNKEHRLCENLILDFTKLLQIFFHDYKKYLMKYCVGDTITAEIVSCSKEEMMLETVKDFFSKYTIGVLTFEGKSLAIYKHSVYFLFDPTDHDYEGRMIHTRPRGQGFAVVSRCGTMKVFSKNILDNLPDFGHVTFTITPVLVEKIIDLGQEPDEYEKVVEKATQEMKECKRLEEKKEPEPELDPKEVELKEKQKMAALEINPNNINDVAERPSYLKNLDIEKIVQEEKEAEKLPLKVQRVLKPKPVSRYVDLIPNTAWILRGLTFQTDKRTTKYGGKQSIGNVIACLATLRQSKAINWTPQTLVEIHQYGDIIYSEARSKKKEGYPLQLEDFPKTVEVLNVKYVVDFEQKCIGQLQSVEYDVLDLYRALEFFFESQSCGMIEGPVTVAVWKEDDMYFMFDPNERDERGEVMALPKFGQMPQRGASCVLMFSGVTNLRNHYSSNLPNRDKNDYFKLVGVQVRDFPDVPAPWHCFEGLKKNRWILRAGLSQNANIFRGHPGWGLQCTAMASTSLFFATLFPNFSTWTSETLNTILRFGNEYYKTSRKAILEVDPENNEHMLCADEVYPKVPFPDYSKEIQLDIKLMICGAMNSIEGVPDLCQGFQQFFLGSGTHAVVTGGSKSVGIWMASPSEYYYFDSHRNNEKGQAAREGTAFLMRTTNFKELAEAVLPNINSSMNQSFNIFDLGIKVVEVVNQVARPERFNFVFVSDKLADYVCILRASVSCLYPKFGQENVGKQMIAMCLTGLGVNKLKKAERWKVEDIDFTLKKGNELHVQSLEKKESPETLGLMDEDEEEEEKKEDVTTLDNVKKEFVLGYNKISFEYSLTDEGNVEDKLIETLARLYGRNPSLDDPNMEMILVSEPYTVAIFRDKGAFYVYDPHGRDHKGEVFGKVDWDDPGSGGVSEGETLRTGGGDAEEEEPEEEEEVTDFNVRTFFKNIGDREWDIGKPRRPRKTVHKYPPTFWEDNVMLYGKACCVRFLLVQDLVAFIYKNYPPLVRPQTDFQLYKIEVNVEVKPPTQKYRPERGDKPKTVYDGNWFKFVEMDKGKWILPGKITMTDKIFPDANKGQQSLCSCVIFVGIVTLYPPYRLDAEIMDWILKYGDRMMSKIRFQMQTNLKANTSMNEQEIKLIADSTDISVNHISKVLRIIKNYISVNISLQYGGNVYAKVTPEEEAILEGEDRMNVNLPQALESFFKTFQSGLLMANGLTVALYKGEMVYYMYDPNNRGPDGKEDKLGTPCVTRFLTLDQLRELFMSNMNEWGNNYYKLYAVVCRKYQSKENKDHEVDEEEEKKAAPVKEPGKQAPQNLTLGGWKKIIAGKYILRGTLDNQLFSSFKAAAFVFVSLAMSLLHSAFTWTYPIVVEISTIGDELFNFSRNEDDPAFDANRPLEIRKVKPTFKVGSNRCQVSVKFPSMAGQINSTDSRTLNLREALQFLFKTNTHGVIEVGGLTFAVWEDQDPTSGRPLIFLYDPVARGPTGLPLSYCGSPYVMYFVHNVEMVTDHIRQIVEMEKVDGYFRVTIAEVIAGKSRTQKKVVDKPKPCPKNKDLSIVMKMTENQLRAKRVQEINAIGRSKHHPVPPGMILRGFKTMYDKQFVGKGKQEMCCCVMALVYSKLTTIETWNAHFLDLVMESGDKVYVSSYNTYTPENPKLGMTNILRNHFINEESVQLKIFKPMCNYPMDEKLLSPIMQQFSTFDNAAKELYFVLEYCDYYYSIILSNNKIFMFDPHNTDHNGDLSESGGPVLYLFQTFDELSDRYFKNYGDRSEDPNKNFCIYYVKVIPSKDPPRRTKCDLDKYA